MFTRTTYWDPNMVCLRIVKVKRLGINSNYWLQNFTEILTFWDMLIDCCYGTILLEEASETYKLQIPMIKPSPLMPTRCSWWGGFCKHDILLVHPHYTVKLVRKQGLIATTLSVLEALVFIGYIQLRWRKEKEKEKMKTSVTSFLWPSAQKEKRHTL